MIPFSPILTPKLCIREFQAADAPAVLAACDQSPAISVMHSGQFTSLPAVERYLSCLAREYAQGLHRTLAIACRETNRLLGMISLQVHPGFPRGELGYWVAPGSQGQGIASEAARAMVAYGFGQCGLHRIQGMHFSDNPASGRVLQNAGLSYEGLLRDYVRAGGEWKDCLVYAALHEEGR